MVCWCHFSTLIVFQQRLNPFYSLTRKHKNSEEIGGFSKLAHTATGESHDETTWGKKCPMVKPIIHFSIIFTMLRLGWLLRGDYKGCDSEKKLDTWKLTHTCHTIHPLKLRFKTYPNCPFRGLYLKKKKNLLLKLWCCMKDFQKSVGFSFFLPKHCNL